MMKFFRKYNKQMLVGLLAFLIIIWLAGDALQQSIAPARDPVVAHSKYGDIRWSDQAHAQMSTRLLGMLGLSWRVPVPVQGIREPLDIGEWILATREAKALGISARVEAVPAWMGPSGTDQEIARVAQEAHVKPLFIREAVRDWHSVQLTARTVAAAATPSLAETRAAALNELDKVKVKTALLASSAFVDKTQEFSEEELNAQFNPYRTRKKGEGLEFGYVVPPTVKVQYIKIDRDALAKDIGVANLESKAKAYYESNKDKPMFRRPPEPVKEPVEGETPEPPKPPQFQWEEEHAQKLAKDVIRKQAADEASARLAEWLIPQLNEPWVDAEGSKDGYKITPEAVNKLEHYNEIFKNVPKALSFPEAIKTGLTNFFAADKAREVPEIGPASYQAERGGVMHVGNLAFKTKGLIPKIPQEKGIDPGDFLAPYQTSKLPLKDPVSGNIFVFRVIDTRDEHPAESLDEVRNEVIADLRLLRAHEVARQRAFALWEKASTTNNLKEAFDGDETLAPVRTTPGAGFFEPDAFARIRPGQSAAVRPTQFTLLSPLVGRVPNDVVDEIFAMATCEDKVHYFELRQRPAFLVVEFVEFQRGREDEFEAAKDRVAQSIVEKRTSEAIRDWLSPENIRLRTGFKLAGVP